MANNYYGKVLDVSAYNPNFCNDATWQLWKSRGVKAAIIKTTESTYWHNAYGAGQVASAKRCGLPVSGYHFARFVGNGNLAQQEAQFAVAWAKAMGIEPGRPLVLDYEENAGYKTYNTMACITFCQTVKDLGYVPVFYSYSGMSARWDYESIYRATGTKLWIAAYPHGYAAAYDPDFTCFPIISNHTDAWQYSSTFYGISLDVSIDLTGVFTTTQQQKITSGGSLDGYSFDGDKVTFNGWFASDKTSGKNYHYIIVTDENGHEFARQSVTLSARPDVAKAFPDIPGGGQSGFSASFDYTSAMAGKKLRVYFRYTDDPAGNGNATDYVGIADLSQSAAYIDSMSTSFGKKLKVAGWFASDLSIGLTNRFLILYDVAAKRELQRVKVDSASRPDVAKANPSIYNGGQSGFSASLDYSADLVGHKLQLIARYSDDKSGEGKRVDYWFEPFSGPAMPVLDGKTEQTFEAHDISIKKQADGTLLVTAK